MLNLPLDCMKYGTLSIETSITIQIPAEQELLFYGTFNLRKIIKNVYFLDVDLIYHIFVKFD